MTSSTAAKSHRPQLPQGLQAVATERLRHCRTSARAAGIELPPREEWPGDIHRVWACSDFVAQSCTRDPALLAGLLTSGDLARSYTADELERRVARAAAQTDSEAELMHGLRRLRCRELVRIAWRDIGGCAAFEETVRDTSAFAEAAIDAALTRLHAWLCAQFGEPRDGEGNTQRLVVLALGKLGGGELNFSSDVDLVFTFPESGHTAGATRSLENEEFFVRLGRRLIHVLNTPTDQGLVFRVDMRLRPFGASGPLASSFNALEDYYQIHGRDWERYALIRARPVAGDRAAGERLLQRLRPFVYRRYMDFVALESLREMKELIAREVQRKGMQDDVKLGPGGIREIEFIGQAFQLVRGGRRPDLREPRILAALARLGELGYLPVFAVEELTRAYVFLRNTEHRLQQAEDRQTHELPVAAAARERLACAMGYADWASFVQRLDAHRTHVHTHFGQVFAAPPDAPSTRAGELDALWEGTLDEGQAAAVLEATGFADGAAAWAEVHKLRQSLTVRSLATHGRQRLQRLVPLLLAAVATTEAPLVTLARTLQVIEAIARRSAYLALLVERPLALSQLVRLCAASPRLARQLARLPLLLDELLDPRTLYAPLERAGLEDELRTRMAAVAADDTEHELDALRQFKQANELRVAAADLSSTIPLMLVSDYLTAIAEVCLAEVLQRARVHLVARHGEPRARVDGQWLRPGFIIVGYGKLGGIELGYGSDLDLVFVHDSHGSEQRTDGARTIENAVYFGRLGQRIIHYLTARTAAGTLYEVDPRLRPSGSSGLLVSSLEAFADYQHNDAWTWEHQALVRARPVAGSPELAARFREIRAAVLRRARDAEALRTAVRDMRERMRLELSAARGEAFDLKQDPGGIADIEFMVQYGVLRWARLLGDYLEFTDNIRLLEGFAKAGLMPVERTELLADAYRAYRARIHALALQEQRPVVPNAEFRDFRAAVRAIWHKLMEA